MSSPTVAEVYRQHWRTLVALHGEPITYRAGDLVITTRPNGDPLRAVAARVDGQQVATGEAITVTSRTQDWLVDPGDLVDETGEQIEPRHGHTITRESGEVYKVQPTGTSDDVWRWSEGLHTWRRIHSERK